MCSRESCVNRVWRELGFELSYQEEIGGKDLKLLLEALDDDRESYQAAMPDRTKKTDGDSSAPSAGEKEHPQSNHHNIIESMDTDF